MLSFAGSLKAFVAVAPCDMRKGFNGLYAAVTERLGEDPKGGRSLCSAIGGARGSKSCIGTAPVCGC